MMNYLFFASDGPPSDHALSAAPDGRHGGFGQFVHKRHKNFLLNEFCTQLYHALTEVA